MISDKHLFWGASFSTTTNYGAARRSDWRRWEERKLLTPSENGNDFGDRFREDFSLLASHGLSQVRLPIDWARIEPFPGRLDHDAIEQTHERFAAAKEAGLTIWATLFDGPLPGWFSEDTDGFRTTHGPPVHWSRHVDRMAEMFDEYVTAWVPAIDPIGWALRSHYFDTAPPGRTTTDAMYEALEGVLDATFEAHRLLTSGTKPVIGNFALPTLHIHEDASAAHEREWDATIWQSWIRAIGEGVLEWPWKAAVERPDMADAFDAIDVGIAGPLGIDPASALTPWASSPAARRDRSGSYPSPASLSAVLDRLRESLPDYELIVSGLGAVDSDDDWRGELFEEWLDQIVGARNDGLAIRGIFLDPVIDGYSQAAGDFVEAGVFTRNREPKPSFQWIQAQQ